MKIHSATEWSKVHDDLKTELRKINYNPDLHRMLKNIDAMVVELSKLEVDARRTRVYRYVNEQLDKINGAVHQLNKMIVFALMLQ